MGDIELREYTQRELASLLADQQFWLQPRLPITRSRVLSYLSNPRAADSDTVLITASRAGRLLAYIGILPDILLTDRQTPMKFGWLSAWWADKTSNNRIAASAVLFAAMKKYSDRIAASSPSDEATRVYDATRRFTQCARFERLFFIIGAPPSVRILAPLVRGIAGVKNRFIVNGVLKKSGLEILAPDCCNAALESFIDKWAAGDPLARDSSYWRWILESPWMSASAEDELTQRRYAFSVFAKDFRQIPLAVSRHGTIIAFLFMTLRNGRLSLKVAYYDPCDTADVAMAVWNAVANINPWVFVSADPALNAVLVRDRKLHIATHRKTSAIYAAKALPLTIGSPPQFGTGDNVFT